jgi:hypothetical protein
MSKPTSYTEVAFTTAPNSTTPNWEDVTQYVRHESGHSIDKWRPDEHATCERNSHAFVLNNSDGRFTPGLTTGAHYPNVKKGRRVRQVSTMFPNTGFETNTTGWVGNNATLAQVATPVRSGVGAMRLTATAAADMSADTPSGTSGTPVVAGAAYVLVGWFRTAVTSRSCKMRVDWYNSGGGLVSSSDPATVVDLTTAYTASEFRVTAPGTAAYARIRAMVTAPAAGEVHYVDAALLGSTRFSGYVDDWLVTWPGMVTSFATCAVTASSRMARLAGAGDLKSIVEEEVLLDNPEAYYTLGEPEGSTQANDSSGNHAEPLLMVGSGSAVTFGTATGPGTDGLTAATFAGGKYLTATGGVQVFEVEGSTTPRLTLEAFMVASATATDSIVCSFQDNAGMMYGLRVTSAGKIQAFKADSVSVSDTITSSTTIEDGAVHHVAITAHDVDVTTLYVDGVSEGTSGGSWLGFGSVLRVTVGGGSLPDGTATTPYTGTVAHFGVTTGSAVLSAARILAHANSGLTGFVNETAMVRLTRYAKYADITTVGVFNETDFETGDVQNLAHIDTTGKTPLAVMREVETTEGGVLFDAADGTLKFHDRSHRYAQASAFTIALSDGVVTVPLAPVLDDQFVVNDMTATGSTGITARVTDDDSIDDDPGQTYRQSVDLATSNAEEPLQAASWRVGRYAQPMTRVPEVAIHLNKATDALVAAVLAAEVGTKVTLTGLPANAPAASMVLFVEGMSEHIDAVEHIVTLRTSDAAVSDVWILDDATYSALGTTTRLAL